VIASEYPTQASISRLGSAVSQPRAGRIARITADANECAATVPPVWSFAAMENCIVPQGTHRKVVAGLQPRAFLFPNPAVSSLANALDLTSGSIAWPRRARRSLRRGQWRPRLRWAWLFDGFFRLGCRALCQGLRASSGNVVRALVFR